MHVCVCLCNHVSLKGQRQNKRWIKEGGRGSLSQSLRVFLFLMKVWLVSTCFQGNN